MKRVIFTLNLIGRLITLSSTTLLTYLINIQNTLVFITFRGNKSNIFLFTKIFVGILTGFYETDVLVMDSGGFCTYDYCSDHRRLGIGVTEVRGAGLVLFWKSFCVAHLSR